MIQRRDVLGAALFAGLAGATSVGAIGFRRAQRAVPPGGDVVLTALPPQLGAWRLQPSRADMVDPIELDAAFAAALDMYDRIVERDYVAPALPRIMLSIVYKRELRQEDRFHWPEFCYATQGFKVRRLAPLALPDGPVVTRFLGDRFGRNELVGYFMRIGDALPAGSLAVRAALFRQSLALRLPDGVMVRASFLTDELDTDDPAAADAVLASFFEKLLADAGRPLLKMLIGDALRSA
ncbi:EpsI family protein [Sphingomonas sp. H39-1-10]|uniref:exosortase C-terminal domain/associated protein EpsI n=1 Tax=Sphingomonas pollutisoli TaxID=3030829 RepID=UPI0023B97BC2|nr:exosortase C-terminal domain/associated protein EpsI [Sphingomonas pollutisoli]MDF0486569.1 EpsI family protein [Sphingomonas pollutisoli]